MAEIRITISEIIDVCIANNLIPDSISGIEISGEHIKFRYKSKKPVSTQIDLEINYQDYSNGMIFLEVQTNWIVDKFLRFKKFPSTQYIQYEHPVITFYLQQFLTDNLKILHIEYMNFSNGSFKIKTFNE
ncbi:MAG: hypothetical protein P9L97_12380 [Candidatus Tenebribacter davisii]|nr:hypothetical protein [Candidatus Tenebribacter davisii]